MLSVSDLDFETNTNGDIDLSIDDLTKFKLLPAIVARPPSGEFKPDAKVYFPRIALAQPLTGDASFTLTAKVSQRHPSALYIVFHFKYEAQDTSSKQFRIIFNLKNLG